MESETEITVRPAALRLRLRLKICSFGEAHTLNSFTEEPVDDENPRTTAVHRRTEEPISSHVQIFSKRRPLWAD